MQPIQFCFIFSDSLEQLWKDNLGSNKGFFNCCQLGQILFWAIWTKNLTVYLVQHKINKGNWKQKLLLTREEVKKPAIFTYFSIFLSCLGLKSINFDLQVSFAWMEELACVWNTSFLNEKQSLWHSVLTQPPFTWGYVNTAFASCYLPCIFNKI